MKTQEEQDFKDDATINQIYEKATAQYLNKCDIDVMDYASEEDRKIYHEAYCRVYGECPFCGEFGENDKCIENKGLEEFIKQATQRKTCNISGCENKPGSKYYMGWAICDNHAAKVDGII